MKILTTLPAVKIQPLNEILCTYPSYLSVSRDKQRRLVFEVDKKFQRISIAIVNFHDLNDIQKGSSAISTDRALLGVKWIATYRNLHKHSYMATFLHTASLIYVFYYILFLLTKSLISGNRPRKTPPTLENPPELI